MEEIKILQQELVNIDKDILANDISEEIYDLVSLLNKRVLVNKKIRKIQWDNLTELEKENKRIADFQVTKLYFEKFKDEISNKYEYKKNYIIFLDKIKAINLEGIQDSIIIKVLISVLNSTEYLNISESECVKIIMSELKKHYELDEMLKRLEQNIPQSSEKIKSFQ